MRILDISDGFTSATAPSSSGTTAISFLSYANDAAFVSANGAAVDSNIYYNTTDNSLRAYINGAWREITVFEA